MPAGFAINRQLVFILKNGAVVVDWGNGWGADLERGEFIQFEEQDLSHAVQDDELESLKTMALVAEYNQLQVYFTYTPEVVSYACRSVSQGVGRMFCLPKTAWPPDLVNSSSSRSKI